MTDKPEHEGPPAIGSSDWYDELAPFGVHRPRLQKEFESAVRDATGEALDALAMGSATPIERGALVLLLHEMSPGYRALMSLHTVWAGMGEEDTPERRWLVRQYAAMLLRGRESVRSSAEYSLWVDFFESSVSEVEFVFQRLVTELPPEAWVFLLPNTGPVPWVVKRDTYWRASREPNFHAALATGIVRSIWDVYGDIDIAEAAVIVDTLGVVDGVVDATVRTEMAKWARGPIPLQVTEIAFVETDEAPWPESFLMVSLQLQTPWALLRGSSLVFQTQSFGTIEHINPPLKAEWPVRRLAARDPTLVGGDGWHQSVTRVRGPMADATLLVGQQVEAWPRGLSRK